MNVRRILLAYLCLYCNAALGQKVALQTQWHGKSLTYDMVVHNPNRDRAWHVLKVGVESEIKGQFNCFGEATVLLPLAKYIIHFRLADKLTAQDADPPIEIPPLATARFTIALYPDDQGACGPWNATVHPVIYFEDGKSLAGPSTNLSAELVATNAAQTLSFSELSQRAESPDAEVRIAAIGKMPITGTSTPSLRKLLTKELTDPDISVRVAAINKSGDLKSAELAPGMLAKASLFASDDETAAYCHAFGTMGYTPAIPFLVAALERNNPKLFVPCRDAVRSMSPKIVIPRLLRILVDNPGWGSEQMWMTQQSLTFREIVSIAVEEGDRSALQSVAGILQSTRNGDLRNFIEQTLIQNAQRGSAILQPFQAPLAEIMRTGSTNDRRAAFDSLVAVLTPEDGLLLVKAEMSDSNALLRASACTAAATRDMRSVLPQMRSILATATDPTEVASCCSASRKMDPSTQCQRSGPR